MNSYLLAFSQDTATREQVVKCIDGIAAISNWMFFFDNTACLVSEESAENVGDRIRERMPNLEFIISRMEQGEKGGWLRKTVWDFMRDPQPLMN